MHHYFIINPIAGRFDPAEIIDILSTVLDKEKYSYHFTDYVLHAEKLAYDACFMYKDVRIYSVGGDGTLNEVANGLYKSGNKNAILIPVPMGSGNDFVRSLGYKKETDVKTLLKKAINCQDDYIDICKANDRYFLNVASIGFDSKVAANAIKYKKSKLIPKGLAYYLSVFTSLLTMKAYEVTITIDDNQSFSKRVTLIALANGKYYGGGIMPAPKADLRDGIIDVCLVDKISRVKVTMFFPKYAKGNHENVKEVTFMRCKSIHIKCDCDNVMLNIDGEISETNDVKFVICEDKIRVGII